MILTKSALNSEFTEKTADDTKNTTVIKWYAAFALAEIAKHNPKARKQVLPIFEKIIKEEHNNGVKSFCVKALKAIEEENVSMGGLPGPDLPKTILNWPKKLGRIMRDLAMPLHDPPDD